jgi:feruloyl esterase
MTRLTLPCAAVAALLAVPAARAATCASLTSFTSEGNTTVSAATEVTSGTLVTPTNQTLTNLPAFCRVQGTSRPTADSDIYFEVWLPISTWNGKFLSSGEGGFVGQLNYTRLGLDGGLDELVRRGYATASTNTGHVSSDTYWAIGHPERVVDYLYRAKHLVTVAAKGLVQAYYGRPATRSYLNSCSNGGRQALMEVQRYPEDYDGVVAGAPWNFQSHSNAGFVWNAQALAAPGAAIPQAKLAAITASVLAACDLDDGVQDGVIPDPRTCKWDPRSLLCDGPETPSCLTAPQLEAVRKIYAGPSTPDHAPIFPGFPPASEVGWAGAIVDANGTGTGGSDFTGLGRLYFANLVYGDPAWDFSTFDFGDDMAYADMTIGAMGNAIDPDLSAARARGVKIIGYHGWVDQVLQPEYAPMYYEEVATANGGMRRTQDFYRLFMVPGMKHCYFGPGATSFGAVGQQLPPVRDADHDVQSALERWVEDGVAPGTITATKYTDDRASTRTVLRTRKLCPYPLVARYSGDPNDASSFACVENRREGNRPLFGTAPRGPR